jgi:hypothetical protein
MILRKNAQNNNYKSIPRLIMDTDLICEKSHVKEERQSCVGPEYYTDHES